MTWRRHEVPGGLFGLGVGDSDRQSIAALQRFVDEVGLYSERAGLPPLTGRILGWLLVAEPPLQTLSNLAAGLGTTAGIIRLAAQPLLHLGIVEMVNPPGDENEYFRLSLAGWSRMVAHQLSEWQHSEHWRSTGPRFWRTPPQSDASDYFTCGPLRVVGTGSSGALARWGTSRQHHIQTVEWTATSVEIGSELGDRQGPKAARGRAIVGPATSVVTT
jgi:hypothetical protein